MTKRASTFGFSSFVMAGLAPAIHVFFLLPYEKRQKLVDPRLRGGDEKNTSEPACAGMTKKEKASDEKNPSGLPSWR